MSEVSKRQKKFLKILENRSFEQLHEFADKKTWDDMPQEEREQLAELFILHGKDLIPEDDAMADEALILAAELAPSDAETLYKIGVVYSTQADEKSAVTKAHEYLQKALKADEKHYDSWYAMGNLHAAIGSNQSDVEHYNKAQECFEKAEKFCSNEKKPHLYHSWGLLWAHQGQDLGEAHDFHEALKYFQKGEQAGADSISFLNDYGFVLKQLGYLVSNPSLFIDALKRFQEAQKKDPDHLPTLVNLAQILSPLYELTDNVDYFTGAHKCHAKILKEHPECGELWITWAFLLSHYGKTFANIEILEASFERFKKAQEISPDYPLLLLRWSDALRAYGVIKEDVGALKEAEEKAKKVLENHPDSVDAWYSFGIGLCEIGRYFDDASYCERALEVFQEGMQNCENNSLLWHGMTNGYMALGDITKDVGYYTKAIRGFEKGIEGGTKLTPPVLNAWGIAYMKLAEASEQVADVETAIEKFEQAIAMAPQVMPEWLYNYGCAHDFCGDLTGEVEHYEKAIQLLNKVLEMDPNDLAAHHSLAVTCSHLGETVGDIDCLGKAAEIFEFVAQHDAEDDNIWCDWGMTLLHLAHLMHDPVLPQKSEALFNSAEEKLQRAISLGSTQALYTLACLYSMTDRFSAAMHFIERSEQSNALPPVDDMLHDDWLKDLRQTEEFKGFLAILVNRKNADS